MHRSDPERYPSKANIPVLGTSERWLIHMVLLWCRRYLMALLWGDLFPKQGVKMVSKAGGHQRFPPFFSLKPVHIFTISIISPPNDVIKLSYRNYLFLFFHRLIKNILDNSIKVLS